MRFSLNLSISCNPICNCVEENFQRIGVDYSKVIKNTEDDLVSIGIIDRLSSMTYEIARLNIDATRDDGLKRYLKEAAKISLDYTGKIDSYSTLSEMIQPNFLYLLSDTKETMGLFDSERDMNARKAVAYIAFRGKDWDKNKRYRS